MQLHDIQKQSKNLKNSNYQLSLINSLCAALIANETELSQGDMKSLQGVLGSVMETIQGASDMLDQIANFEAQKPSQEIERPQRKSLGKYDDMPNKYDN